MRFYLSYTNRRHNTYGAGTLAGYGTHTRGWNAGVEVTCLGEKGEPDSFAVEMTGGSTGSGGSKHLGTVHDTPDGPRWVPADTFLSSIPGRVGSPSMEVVAAIPYGTDGREFKCVVLQASSAYSDNPAYGVVSAYRNSDDDRWHATGGHYDLTLHRAVRVMAERAGAVIRPSQRDEAKIRDLMEAFRIDAASYDEAFSEDLETLFGLVENLLDEATQ